MKLKGLVLEKIVCMQIMSETIFCPDKSFTIHIYTYIKGERSFLHEPFFLTENKHGGSEATFFNVFIWADRHVVCLCSFLFPLQTSELKERERERECEEWVRTWRFTMARGLERFGGWVGNRRNALSRVGWLGFQHIAVRPII